MLFFFFFTKSEEMSRVGSRGRHAGCRPKKKLGSLGGGTTVAGKGMAIKIMQYCLEFFWDLPIASSNTMW